MTVLLGLPALLVLFVAATVAIGLTYLAHRLVLRRFDTVQFKGHNDVAGFMITVVGTLYAVMFGLVTVSVWQQYDATRDRANLETSAVADVWHTVAAFPAPVRDAVQGDMRRYTDLMIREEYPMMRSGASSLKSYAVLMHAMGQVTALRPAATNVGNAQQVALGLLNEMHDMRQRRLASNEETLSWFLWVVLALGAATIIGLALMFGIENRHAHFTMTGATTLIIVSMFVLVFELEYPFRSDLRIRPEPWLALTAHIQYMDQMKAMNEEY